MRKIYTLLLLAIPFISFSQNNETREPITIYKFEIKEMIAPPVVRLTSKAIDEAHKIKADYIFLELNTYGGMVDAADSIRTKLLNSKIPTFVLIQNNAASAGALISIACDSIYMQPGSTIGAATVVNESGEQVPDKYQSYMRKKMRATAEQKGRDPLIAEAMVDADIYIPGVIDSGKVITFSTKEAIQHGFCEAELRSLAEIMERRGIENYTVVEHTLTATDKIIAFLINPTISGILIMIIIGGIYFELQTPGVGFPLVAAITAATLYFAPLYLEGLAANWEILLFIAGLLLLGVEIFVIPGFGVAGISGIVLMVTGLTLSMIENVGFDFSFSGLDKVVQSLLIVMISSILAIVGSLYFGGKFITSPMFSRLILKSEQTTQSGYSSVDLKEKSLIGKMGVTLSMMRPIGKIEIDGEQYSATAETGFIEKDEKVLVTRFEAAQLFVRKVD